MTMVEPITTDQSISNDGLEAYFDWGADYADKSFYAFRQLINPKFKWGWFTRSVATELYRFYHEFCAGRRPILLLQTPPQHGKSMSVIDFAGWVAGHRPDTRIVYASFSDRLGIRANLRIQRLMGRELYKRAFPNTRLSDTHVVTIAERHLRNHEVLEFVDQDGMFRNTTVNGAITGEGFDLMIVDDPVKGRAEVSSPTIRDKTWAWFSDDLLTRQSEHAALLFIGTRWHVDDPAGRLLERFGDRARVLRFPALAEQDEPGFRRRGEPLFPEIKSRTFLDEVRRTMTDSSWEALYQQSPYLVGGGIFPIERFQLVPSIDSSKIKKSVRYVDKACLVAGTLITTDAGQMPIETIQAGDRVLTRSGFYTVTQAWLTKRAEALTTVVFSDGNELTGTADHLVWVSAGYWVALGDLRCYDRILHQDKVSWQTLKNIGLKVDAIGARNNNQSRGVAIFTAIGGTQSINVTSGAHSIATFGQQPTVRYPVATISTIATATGITTTLRTLSQLSAQPIEHCTLTLKRLETKCGCGIASTVRRCIRQQREQIESLSITLVQNAASHSARNPSLLSSVSESSVSANVGTSKTARGAPVYDLMVEGEHEFFANGVLVHNSTEGGGAYTAMVLMHSLSDGRYAVSDVRHGQWGALEREQRLEQTARIDAASLPRYEVVVEQEPGSGGKESAESTIRRLSGLKVSADKVTGDKETRAEPYAAQVQGGNVMVVTSGWTRGFLDEHECFPAGKRKDMVDAAAGAFAKLATPGYDTSMSWVE